MITAFFTQNVKRGGLDTFILNLIAHWPQEDEVILFCNRSHPGLDDLNQRLAGRVEIVSYDFWIAQDIGVRLAHVPSVVRHLFLAAFWLFGFPYLVFKTGALLRKFKPNRLMVINGGYPGGDACLAATIAWGRIEPGSRAWHNFHNLVLPYSRQPLRRLKEWLVDYFVAGASAGFVTVSAACLETLGFRPRLATSAKEFIHNGISPIDVTREGSLIEELGLPDFSRVILMLAVYEPRKGHAFIIRAMEAVVSQVPNAVLVICGDGSPEEMDIVREMRDASVIAKHIVLQGHRSDLGSLMSQSEVLVQPSQGHESFGYTVVEAMACGCPVVVTNIGGLPEVVDDGGSGYVVPSDDLPAFASRIVTLLQDDALRKQMGAAGRKRYLALFQAQRMSADYYRLLEETGRMQADRERPKVLHGLK